MQRTKLRRPRRGTHNCQLGCPVRHGSAEAKPPMSRKTPSLTDFRRIVIKVGSSLLVDSGAGRVHEEWLASLAEDIAQLHKEKRDILVVSSGAIALGRA